jgi:hypothetical protein
MNHGAAISVFRAGYILLDDVLIKPAALGTPLRQLLDRKPSGLTREL